MTPTTLVGLGTGCARGSSACLRGSAGVRACDTAVWLQVLPVLQRHLSAGAGPQVIHRVLSSLSELVRTEELECLQAVEQQKEEHLPDSKDRAKVRPPPPPVPTLAAA